MKKNSEMKPMNQKRALAVHDISCVGKCSLTVALPILSAAGVETSVLPTAVLSTHTGGFTGYTFRDLTDDILPIMAHWKSLDLHADAIYTGYLGSFRQLELVGQLIDTFRSGDTVVLIDPVMADNGVLYASFTQEFVRGMAALCGKADVIVPNLTEACLMLGEPYRESGYDRSYIENILKKLSGLGPEKVVLSGVTYAPDKLGAAAYDRSRGEFYEYFADRVDGYYHGTGDVFASALLGALLNGKPLPEAEKIAVDFTVGSIRRTYEAGTDVKYGVNFEQELPELIRAIQA